MAAFEVSTEAMLLLGIFETQPRGGVWSAFLCWARGASPWMSHPVCEAIEQTTRIRLGVRRTIGAVRFGICATRRHRARTKGLR